MSCTWAIDALDARGGLAFASCRTFSLSDEGDQLRDAPCVWIAPPYFEPEPVVSRAVAWSADRGAFQLGVFHDGYEVRFETIEAVTEFVRRTYLRSAGGDGLTGGGTPLPPPSPPDAAPDLRPPTLPDGPDGHSKSDGMPVRYPTGSGDAGSAIDILRLLKNFEASARAQTGPVIGASMQWIGRVDEELSVVAALPQVGELRSAQDQLVWASLLLMHELLLRLPQTRQPAEILSWQRSARTLGKIMTEFGTWDWLLLGPDRFVLREWAKHSCATCEQVGLLPTGFYQLFHDESYGFVIFYSRLFDSAAFRAAWPDSARSLVYDMPFIWASAYISRPSTDPVEDLSCLPLPAAQAKCVRQDKLGDVNVFQLLSAASGAPLSLCDDGAYGRDAVAILLFAAGWLHQSKEVLTSPTAAPAVYPVLDLELARVSDLVGRAWEWLARSMPRLAFPYTIEIMIAQASSLRYGGEANFGASDPRPRGGPPGGGSSALQDAPIEEVSEASVVSDPEEVEPKEGDGRTQNDAPPFMSA